MPLGLRDSRPNEHPITVPIIRTEQDTSITTPTITDSFIPDMTASFEFTRTEGIIRMSFITGWQYISFPIAFAQDFKSTFENARVVGTNLSPIQLNYIIIAKNYLGAAYLPDFDFNGIGDIEPSFGYQIKTSNSFEMTVPFLSETKIRNFDDWSQALNRARQPLTSGWNIIGYARRNSVNLIDAFRTVEYTGFPREYGHTSALPGTVPVLSSSYVDSVETIIATEGATRGQIVYGEGTNFTEHFTAGDDIQFEFFMTTPVTTGSTSIPANRTFTADESITFSGAPPINTNGLILFNQPENAQSLIDLGLWQGNLGWSGDQALGSTDITTFEGQSLYLSNMGDVLLTGTTFKGDELLIYNHGSQIVLGGVTIRGGVNTSLSSNSFNVAGFKIYGNNTDGKGPISNWNLLTTVDGPLTHNTETLYEWIPTGSFAEAKAYQYYAFEWINPTDNSVAIKRIRLKTGFFSGNERALYVARDLDGFGVKWNAVIDEVISDTKIRLTPETAWEGFPYEMFTQATHQLNGSNFYRHGTQIFLNIRTEHHKLQNGDIRNDSGSLIGYPDLKIYKIQSITGSLFEDQSIIKDFNGAASGFQFEFMYGFNGIGSTTAYTSYQAKSNQADHSISHMNFHPGGVTGGVTKNQSIMRAPGEITNNSSGIQFYRDYFSGSNLGLIPKVEGAINFSFTPYYETDTPLYDQEDS